MSTGFPSISSSLRTPRVYGGYAENAQSERFQDSRFNICPNRTVDSYGRCAPKYGVRRLTGGCHPASERVNIETAIRPAYHPYLNVGGLQGKGYDTLHGASVPGRDEAYGCSGSYASQNCSVKSGGSACERKRYAAAMQRYNASKRFKNQ